ncbi:hypothetical protein EQU24_14325 [Methylotuvimicrobium buryatense]|uniref:Uncharacterized protein n=1 Tax=Methylotuvimicrobium buryatense TaxID=95641 RepID=A0A4P9UUD2_METBY|nr:hypothetical protein EQU24_14325 [Methylotuvimicrobium buryatense]
MPIPFRHLSWNFQSQSTLKYGCIPFAIQISAMAEDASGRSTKALPAWNWHRGYRDVFTASC